MYHFLTKVLYEVYKYVDNSHIRQGFFVCFVFRNKKKKANYFRKCQGAWEKQYNLKPLKCTHVMSDA